MKSKNKCCIPIFRFPPCIILYLMYQPYVIIQVSPTYYTFQIQDAFKCCKSIQNWKMHSGLEMSLTQSACIGEIHVDIISVNHSEYFAPKKKTIAGAIHEEDGFLQVMLRDFVSYGLVVPKLFLSKNWAYLQEESVSRNFYKNFKSQLNLSTFKKS